MFKLHTATSYYWKTVLKMIINQLLKSYTIFLKPYEIILHKKVYWNKTICYLRLIILKTLNISFNLHKKDDDTRCTIKHSLSHHHTPYFNYASWAKALPTIRRETHARYQIHYNSQEKKQGFRLSKYIRLYHQLFMKKVLEFISTG